MPQELGAEKEVDLQGPRRLEKIRHKPGRRIFDQPERSPQGHRRRRQHGQRGQHGRRKWTQGARHLAVSRLHSTLVQVAPRVVLAKHRGAMRVVRRSFRWHGMPQAARAAARARGHFTRLQQRNQRQCGKCQQHQNGLNAAHHQTFRLPHAACAGGFQSKISAARKFAFG